MPPADSHPAHLALRFVLAVPRGRIANPGGGASREDGVANERERPMRVPGSGTDFDRAVVPCRPGLSQFRVTACHSFRSLPVQAWACDHVAVPRDCTGFATGLQL